MSSRPLSALIIGLAIVIVVSAGVLAYTTTLRQSSVQPVQVTWRDATGGLITSVSLVSSSTTYRSQTVSFTCSGSVGAVSLQLSSSISEVHVYPSIYASCTTSPNYVTLSVSATNSVAATGALQVIQSDIYRTLPGQLTINVQVS